MINILSSVIYAYKKKLYCHICLALLWKELQYILQSLQDICMKTLFEVDKMANFELIGDQESSSLLPREMVSRLLFSLLILSIQSVILMRKCPPSHQQAALQ